MGCAPCTNYHKKWWTFGVSFVVLLLALVIGLTWSNLSSRILYNQFVLKNGTRNYDIWMNAPVPIYFEIFLFNWTNPEEIRNASVKPRFEQMGPYTFLEKHERVDLKWNDNNTITFNQKRIWHFIPEMSNGSLDDSITNLNVITASVAYQMRDQSSKVILKVVDLMLQRFGTLLYTKPVRELLYDGFKDPLLEFLKKANLPGMNLPDTFGWFAGRNESSTYDGTFVMNTGSDGLEKLGYVTHWNNQSRVPYYRDDCGLVMGTTGELWPPVSGTPDITVFAPDICRGLTLKYDSKVQKYGLNGLKWVGDDRVFDNGIKYPEASCWCSADETQCPDLKPGVFNISSCKFNAPSFVSYPHFYLADSSYLENIDGLNPNRDEHEFYIALEPVTGIPLEVKAQLQINILIEPSTSISIFKDIPKMMIPMMWFRQRVNLTEDLADQAKVAALLPIFGFWVAGIVTFIGFGLLIVASYFTLYKWNRDDLEIPLLE